jgi:hypothetical protein
LRDSHLSLAFSSWSALGRRASDISSPPSFERRLSQVGTLTPCRRRGSLAIAPA